MDIKKDNVEIMFDKESATAFREFIAEVDSDTEWSVHPLREVFFSPLDGIVADDLFIGGDEELEDSKLNGLPIMANLPDGKAALMRPYLWKQVKQHHRDTAPIVGDMANAGAWGSVCEHLNLGRDYLKRDVLVMTRGGKISGWFSEFNTNRTQTQQLDMLEFHLEKSFPRYSFYGGLFNHLFTEARYSLDVSMAEAAETIGEEKTVMASYVSTWKKCGIEADIDVAVPMVKFMTGESGMTSIVISPYVVLDSKGKTIPLGPSLSIKHRGSDEGVWGKFEEFGGQIATMYQSGMKALTALCERKVYHPYSCMTRCLKPFLATAPWSAIEDLADSFMTFFDPKDPDATCLAVDIFNYINDMVDEVNEKCAPTRRLQNKETVARLLAANWDALDVSKPLILFPKKADKDAALDVEAF